MTVQSTLARWEMTGNDVADTLAITGKFYEDTDLIVTKVLIATEAETALVLNTDYVVVNNTPAAGGNVVLTVPLPTGYRLEVRRVLALLQSADIRNQGNFFAEVHEDVFDRFIMICQQQQDKIDRLIFGDEDESLFALLAGRPGDRLHLPYTVPVYDIAGQEGNTVAAAMNNLLGTVTPTVSEQRVSGIRVGGTLAGTATETALNAFAWDLQQNATGVNSRVRGAFGEVRLNSSTGVRGMQSVVRAIGAAATGDMTAIVGQIQIDAGGNPSQANGVQVTLVSEAANFGTGIKIARAGGSGGSYAYGLLMDEGGTTYGTAAIRLPNGPVSGKIMWAGGAFIRNTASDYLEVATRLGLNIEPASVLHAAIADAAGAAIVTLSNLSAGASINKIVRVAARGRTTGATDLDVGEMAWSPLDNDWATSKMNIHFRRGGAIDEALQLTPDISAAETCMVIKRNVGGVFSMARVTMGAVDSGGTGFKLLRVIN